jgi:hypothetical protein
LAPNNGCRDASTANPKIGNRQANRRMIVPVGYCIMLLDEDTTTETILVHLS